MHDSTSALRHAFHAVLHHLEKLTILSHKPLEFYTRIQTRS